MPSVYDGADAWAGAPPQQMLAKALKAIPGAALAGTASSISLADADADADPPATAAEAEAGARDDPAAPAQQFHFSVDVAALDSKFTAEATAESADSAREGAALCALHKCPSFSCCLHAWHAHKLYSAPLHSMPAALPCSSAHSRLACCLRHACMRTASTCRPADAAHGARPLTSSTQRASRRGARRTRT